MSQVRWVRDEAYHEVISKRILFVPTHEVVVLEIFIPSSSLSSSLYGLHISPNQSPNHQMCWWFRLLLNNIWYNPINNNIPQKSYANRPTFAPSRGKGCAWLGEGCLGKYVPTKCSHQFNLHRSLIPDIPRSKHWLKPSAKRQFHTVRLWYGLHPRNEWY